MATVYDRDRKVKITPEGINVVRTLYVEPYSSYPTVCATLMGGVRLIAGRLIRTLPKRDPYHKWLFCQEIDVDGEGAWVGTAANGTALLDVANYYNNGAVLTCTYKPLPVNTVEGPSATAQQEIDFATRSLDFNAQNLTIPGDRYKFHTSTVILQNQNLALTKTVPKVDLVLARNYVLRVPYEAINRLNGRINASDFNVAGYIWFRNTLRFDGAHSEQKITQDGYQYWRMTYKFAVQPTWDKVEDGSTMQVGWNRAFDAKNARWDVVEAVADSTRRIYLEDSGVTQTIGGTTITGFNLLFHPAAS